MWLIIRTDFRKEAYVARQIANMGFPAWVPCQLVASRPGIARRVLAKPIVAVKELPVLPRRLFAAVPSWAVSQAELDGIRHMEAIERDAEQAPVWIPDAQIAAFRAEIDRVNTATLALATRQNRRQKAQWKDMRTALLDMIHQAKGQMEQAA